MMHMDEAHGRAEEFLLEFLDAKGGDWRGRVLLIKDVSARLRAILWGPSWEAERRAIDEGLRRVSQAYWSGSVLRGRPEREPDGRWQDDAWRQAGSIEGSGRLRVLERHLTKPGWFQAPGAPPWPATEADAPAIALFYSFKGGVGRSTALAASALHLASGGDRVVVLDADLDSPGVGWLLSGLDGGGAAWGVVDYLLERPVMDTIERADGDAKGLDLDDYHHRVPRSFVPEGEGEIFVFPAGRSGVGYVDKLARLDYGMPRIQPEHPFAALLRHIRGELEPQWILIDARAGLGDVSGFLTGGLCHLHVLFGTLADASSRGLGMMLDRLGRDRLLKDAAQAECITVAAMIPRTEEARYRESVERFVDRGRDLFSEHYYAEPGAGEDLWTLDDVENTDAPHVPVVLPYDERLAVFRGLDEVAAPILLEDEPYGALAERLREGFKRIREGVNA